MGESYASRIKRTLDVSTGIIQYHFTNCDLHTADNIHDFFKSFADSLAELPAPRDVIVCLDQFTVAPELRELYGEVRAKVARAYYRYSARYAGNRATKLATMAGAVRHKTEGMVYDTLEEATAAILKARENAY